MRFLSFRLAHLLIVAVLAGCSDNALAPHDMSGHSRLVNISGVVVDADGIGVRGARVLAGSRSTLTRPSGQFFLGEVPVRNDTIVIECSQSGAMTRFVRLMPLSERCVLTLTLDDDPEVGTLDADRGGALLFRGVRVDLQPLGLVSSSGNVHHGAVTFRVAEAASEDFWSIGLGDLDASTAPDDLIRPRAGARVEVLATTGERLRARDSTSCTVAFLAAEASHASTGFAYDEARHQWRPTRLIPSPGGVAVPLPNGTAVAVGELVRSCVMTGTYATPSGRGCAGSLLRIGHGIAFTESGGVFRTRVSREGPIRIQQIPEENLGLSGGPFEILPVPVGDTVRVSGLRSNTEPVRVTGLLGTRGSEPGALIVGRAGGRALATEGIRDFALAAGCCRSLDVAVYFADDCGAGPFKLAPTNEAEWLDLGTVTGCATAHPFLTAELNAANVKGLDLSADGSVCLVRKDSGTGTVHMQFDSRTGLLRRSFSGGRAAYSALAPDGSMVVVGYATADDAEVYFVRLDGVKTLGHFHWVTSVLFERDSRRALVRMRYDPPTIGFINLVSFAFESGSLAVSDVPLCVLSSGRGIVVRREAEPRTIAILDPRSGAARATIASASQVATPRVWTSTTSQYVVVETAPGKVRAFSTSTGQPVGAEHPAGQLVLGPRLVAVSGVLRDLVTWDSVGTLPGWSAASQVPLTAWSADGAWLAGIVIQRDSRVQLVVWRIV